MNDPITQEKTPAIKLCTDNIPYLPMLFYKLRGQLGDALDTFKMDLKHGAVIITLKKEVRRNGHVANALLMSGFTQHPLTIFCDPQYLDLLS